MEEGGTGGEHANTNDIIAQYQTTRIRTLWAGYKRIFQLTKEAALTLDPSNFSVTNTFPYSSIIKLGPDDKVGDQFNMDVDKTAYSYKTAHRAQLLCQLFECICKKVPNKFRSSVPFVGSRVRKSGSRVDCKIVVAPYGLLETDMTDRLIQVYYWVNVTRIGSDERQRGFFFEASGRTKIFIFNDLEVIISACKSQLRLVGMESLPFISNQNITPILTHRNNTYSASGSPVSVFDVNKFTRRSIRPMPRQLHVSENFLVEKDASGFQYISMQRVANIYAIVRSWTNPREFTIEYQDGTSRTYTTPVRDTVLAIVLDVCRAAGNSRVIVTGEISDNLRLMPRFAEEDYQSSIKDAFFGASSIEAWFLTRLSKACKAIPPSTEAIEKACKELNANVPCPGINPTSDQILVKTCMAGILKQLNSTLLQASSNEQVDLSRPMATLLQSLFRIIPCVHGYKGFVEVKEIDTRLLLLQLIRFDSDFVNYWALEVLTVLCKSPVEPRNTQQEFVNKHTLLTDKMLTFLIDLMAERIEAPLDFDESDCAEAETPTTEEPIEAPETTPSVSASSSSVAPELPPKKKVSANPSTIAHLPMAGDGVPRQSSKMIFGKEGMVKQTTSEVKTAFYPNSLVIVSAASLLESIVSSKKDTSSPELVSKVLDMLAERCEVLINMLRSNSFTIMENAAILMFILLKNRPRVGPILKELALSECLVLKHFHNAVFSPSGAQRFISRFLIATWMSGPASSSPGKALLNRIIPSGLVEYLKFAAITEDHRRNLDEMEDDFYAALSGIKPSASKAANDMQTRLRLRIANVLKEQRNAGGSAALPMPIPASVSEGSSSSPSPPPAPVTPAVPENYRIMFHVMTQDHKMPDLIWNEQTRLELRSTLDAEIKEFEREQRLRGSRKIAWNYQQFFVKYESLRDEIQVGPIYIRYFLDSGDSFLRALENPSHTVLFEKMFRRVLVNLDRNPSLSILCTRCLTKLYQVCRDIIGPFDDTALITRMLEQAHHMELQHCVLDLLEALTLEEANMLQLLEKSFVNLMIKYISFAHINPDTIGNILARATSNVLMLKDSDEPSSSSSSTPIIPSHDPEAVSSSVAAVSEEDERRRKFQRAQWVPDDSACPRVWFVASPDSPFPPPPSNQKGPFRLTELVEMLDRDSINRKWLVAPSISEESDELAYTSKVDTGRWKPLDEHFQLRIQFLYPGKSIYSPAEVAMRGLVMLSRLASIHKASNSQGVPFYPIPTSKKIMSDAEHLTTFAQLLLSNESRVVETAASLIQSLVEFNPAANSKLYLTGVFFFACRYTGNAFQTISNLFYVTHLQQSFHDAAASVARELPVSQRSILGNMLTAAMVNILVNYGPERFASIFTGDFDTPEVIWNAELRQHVVTMIDQHIGNFAGRLRQFTQDRYDYCPIPKIHFPTVDREIYVHEYYLKNLCDEVRFPEWPIGDPLLLLRESIQRWREEMSKGVVDSSVSQAKKILGLPEKFETDDLRKAYRSLARQYHPDKNPNGRDMFEKIHVAYDLLSSIKLQVVETDMLNVLLLIKTQNIIYRRFSDIIADQKYPAYPLLISVLTIPSGEVSSSATDAQLLLAGCKLIFYTCSVSPLNGKEFVKSGGVPKLYEIVRFSLEIFKLPESKSFASDLLVHSLKAFTSVCQYEVGREAIRNLCPTFAEDIYSILVLHKEVPLAAENAVETVARCSELAELQNFFIHAGIVWKLIPMLLAFDGTLQDDYSNEDQRSSYNQSACNVHAILAAKALGRLGGFMFEELESPRNPPLQDSLNTLLTQPLAKLLRNRRPWDLLGALNENVEKVTKIWNVSMRKELLDLVLRIDRDRTPGSNPNELQASEGFVFSSIRSELCIGGVYVRIFVKNSEITDIEDCSGFCHALITFIHNFLSKGSSSVSLEHQEYSFESLRILGCALKYIPHDIASHPQGFDVVFGGLSLYNPESPCFHSLATLLNHLGSESDFVLSSVRAEPPCLWRLVRAACKTTGPAAPLLWGSLEGFASIPEALNALLVSGAVMRLLGLIVAVPGYASVFQNRLSAVSLLSKFLWNPVRGSEACNMLRRFLPEPVVNLLRSRAGNASLQVLDEVSETPELIWTKDMQEELRKAILELTNASKSASTSALGDDAEFSCIPDISPEYSVRYEQLMNELFVGGVYIRLYLKQPTFRLSNPILFLEKTIEFWESAFTIQVPLSRGGPSSQSSADSRAVVLGNEDFLSLLTSCIICVVKGESSVLDHILSWGFPHNLCSNLQRALGSNRRGTPLVCVTRLLHQLVSFTEVLDNLMSSPVDLIAQLTRVLDVAGVASNRSGQPVEPQPLPKESAFFVELLKKIFQSTSRYLGHFVSSAMSAGLPMFVLTHIIGGSKAALSEVRSPSALRIHAVDLMKAIIAASDETNAHSLRAMLDLHPAWSEFREQSHDLFLTNDEKTDVFLIEDAAGTRFAGLLTDGSAQQGISQFFSSTGIPLAHTTGNFPSPQVPPAQSPPSLPPPRVISPISPPNPPSPSLPSPQTASFSSQTSSTGRREFRTRITKSIHGLGLDLGKTPDGGVVVQRLKEMPDGSPNPASQCSIPVCAGDLIVGVNGVGCRAFADVVKNIRASSEVVELWLER